MSTILSRRLKATRAKPVLVRDDLSSELLTVDLRIATLDKEDLSTWSSLDCGYDSCSASSSSSSSSSSSNGSSIFFEEMDDLELLPEESARSSPVQEEAIPCPACDEEDDNTNAVEEFWQEHVVYQREITPSRSHRESSRRSKSSSSSSSHSRSRRHTPPSATVCPPSTFRPSARSSRRKQVPSSSPPSSSSSSSSDEEDAQYKLRSSRLRRSKRLADCECDPLACPPSPHPQAVELCPIVEARLRTTVNPSFYLIYSLENVMMKERKIRYPLKDRATHLSFGTCRGSLALSPLRCELSM